MNQEMRDIVLTKYNLIQLVGKGSFGFVTKANCKITNKLVALKVI
jgi:serine/threonine protein kinase